MGVISRPRSGPAGFLAPKFRRRKILPTLQPTRSLCGPPRYSSYARLAHYLGDRCGLVPGTE